MADVERYVDTTATAGGDGTTRNHSGATRAYASLSAWESAEGADLVTATQTHRVRCAGSTADTTAVTINGFTTNATYFVTVQADDAAPDNDGFYDEDLVWHASYYRISQSSSFVCLLVDDAYTVIDGIQVEQLKASASAYAIQTLDPECTVQNCRVTGGNVSGRGITGDVSTHAISMNIYNNIVFDFTGIGIALGSSGSSVRIHNAYNNVVFDCGTGIGWVKDHADVTYNFYNNTLYNNTTNIATAPVSSPWNHDYNAIDEATNSETNGVALGTGSLTADMVDPENATMKSRNVRAVAAGDLENAGTATGAPSTDLWGTTRSDPPEIGVHEIAAAAGGIEIFRRRIEGYA